MSHDAPEPAVSPCVQVMAPTRMKLRVRRRDNATTATGAAEGGGPPEEEEERRREGGGGRRKNTRKTSAAAASSSPPTSSASASARAVMAAGEASPDSKCPICLDRFNNLAYLDRCLHRFCFPCIQEWSHNKAECPLCKQPFASILHSVRAEDDFKEYTLRPPPANSSVAATVAMVAAMASAARSNHQMRLMLRRHRVADGGETTARRRRRERRGRGGGGGREEERAGVWEWYLDSPPPPPHPTGVSPVVAEDSEEERRTGGGADPGAAAPVAPNDRASRRLMTRLAARQRLQRDGGTVRRLRERETVAFRRALYRCGVRVRGVAGVNGNQGQHDITAESFRRSPAYLNRLRPWLRRELTVLYGAHASLVDIVQRIIMARLARHGLEDTPTIEEELRPFLLARTEHFLHELVSFARSPLSLDNYDQRAAYEPPAALELDWISSSSESSSVIAISEGEEEERGAGGGAEEGPAGGAHDDVIQTGSCLSLSAWDDETPGPSYSSAEPSCSLAPLAFSPAPHEAANEEGAARREEGEECLIVGYKKPIAERTPELVQLSSDTEEEEEEPKREDTLAETLPSPRPPSSVLPAIPPSTSAAYREEPGGEPNQDGEAERSWSGGSGRSRNSVFTLSPATPGEEERRRERGGGDGKQSGNEAARERRRRKRRRRGRERSGEGPRKSGTLYNPNRSIYPAMMRRSPSPFHSSAESASSWERRASPLTSPPSSSSSPLRFSPPPQTPPTPSLSPGDAHHGEKPGGKRKYKSRHLDGDVKDPTWRPSGGRRERRRRGRDGRRRKERPRRDRKSRDERSPSVEIIYEGTASEAPRPPAHKRRRKGHRRTQRSSSPVIITLDSDSSRDDVSNRNNVSSSSSPISSQQTVDFSDLPPLPSVHSAGGGGATEAEIGELPIDFLDRGSEGSEAGGPIAVDNSDDSDRDVDVENVEVGGSPLPCDDGPIAAADTKVPGADGGGGGGAEDGGCQPIGERLAATTDPVPKRRPEASSSDGKPLTTVLGDLKGVAAPDRDLSVNSEASWSPDTRRRRDRDPCEVSRAHRNRDGRLAETRRGGADRPAEDKDQNRAVDRPAGGTSGRSPPPLERAKECRVREEAGDVPPLLKQASPVRSYNRNTPPPLKHKDAGSPRRSPHHASVDAPHPVDSRSVAPPTENPPVPPVSTPKRRFSSCPVSGSVPAAPQLGPWAAAVRSGLKPPGDSRSSSAADHFTRPVFSSFHSSQFHSSRDPPLAADSSTVDFYSQRTGWCEEQPAHSDSTSAGCRDETARPASCRVAPGDLHPSSGAAVFSGVNSTAASLPVSSVDSRTSCSPADLHFSAAAGSGTLSEISHEVASRHAHPPPVDLHCTGPAPPADGHSNHAALSSSPSERSVDFHTARRKGGARSDPTGRARSEHQNHFDPGRRLHQPPAPVNSHSKRSQTDFKLHTHNHLASNHLASNHLASNHLASNHLASSPESDSNSSADGRSDARSPVGELSNIWNTNTRSATQDAQTRLK
ncbi:uncharacterized protein [Embiotoca jacksoni]|uniref:uncharacterized protein n=1 Tax=Embiotoca jacksoni TaxID=100190 RepID=UPI003703F097